MAYLLSENFFNVRQFPSHTINSRNQADGYEVYRVANARRHTNNYYTGTTDAQQAYIQASCDRVRAADMLVIDRNSNLSGATVRVRASNTILDHTTAATRYEEVSFTVPANTYAGNYLSAGHPVRTDEGAIVYRFAPMAGKFWSVFIDSMGSNTRQQVGGLWLGKSWSPEITPMPWDDEPRWLEVNEFRRGSPSEYSRTGRQAQLVCMLRDDTEWMAARWYIHSLFWKGHSMWYVPDLANAERTWLAYAPSGEYSAPYQGRRGRDLALTMVEYQPVRL